jgi:hypothetical protein
MLPRQATRIACEREDGRIACLIRKKWDFTMCKNIPLAPHEWQCEKLLLILMIFRGKTHGMVCNIRVYGINHALLINFVLCRFKTWHAGYFCPKEEFINIHGFIGLVFSFMQPRNSGAFFASSQCLSVLLLNLYLLILAPFSIPEH